MSFGTKKIKLKLLEDFLGKKIGLTSDQEEERALCEASFLLFVEKAWPIIEGAAPFVYGWHIKALCEHLEALYYLDINRLIVNLPPRLGKSNVCSVLYCAWIWTKEPHLRFLYSSYAQVLSVRDSVKCRRLIQSNWYQSLWGDKFYLMSDVNNKLRFENNKTGSRIASSVGGSNTGEGAHFEICTVPTSLINTDKRNITIGEIVDNKLDVKVLSYNHNTRKTEFKPILDYMSTTTDKLVEIEFEDDTTLEVTPNHPIWTARGAEGGQYTPAHSVQVGDAVLKSS